MADQISFAEFGPRFIAELLTGELIAAEVRAAIPARIWINEDAATGFADFKGVDRVLPVPDRCQVACDVTIHLTVSLTTKALGVLPPIDTTVRLKLIFQAYAPLYLLAEIPPLAPGDLQLVYQPHNPLDWVVIEGVVRGKIQDTINKQVQDSRYGRIIDLEAMLLEQTAHAADDPNRPPAQPLDITTAGSDVLVPRSDLASGVVAPGQALSGWVLLNRNEVLHVAIYGKMLQAPALIGSFGANGDFTLKGKNQAESSTFSVLDQAWGDNYALAIFPDSPDGFKPAATGWYQFVLHVDKLSPSKCAFLIKQQRSIGTTDLLAGRAQICFDQLGQNLFQIGFSKEMLRRTIAAQLQAARARKQLQMPWHDSPFGDILISLDPKFNDIAPVASATPDREVLWKLDVSAKFRALREIDQLFALPLTIKPTLALVATKNPTAIQIELRPLQKGDFTIDESGIQVLNPEAEKFVHAMLSGDLSDRFEQLVSDLSQKLLTAMVVSTEVISAIAEQQARSLQPPPPQPRPVFDGKPFKPVQIAPGADAGFRVTISAHQKVIGTARVSPLRKPGLVGATASLAICDDLGGMLAESVSTTWNAGQTGERVLTLRFTAATDGPYTFRVRADPTGGDDYAGIQCEFLITEAK